MPFCFDEGVVDRIKGFWQAEAIPTKTAWSCGLAIECGHVKIAIAPGAGAGLATRRYVRHDGTVEMLSEITMSHQRFANDLWE